MHFTIAESANLTSTHFSIDQKEAVSVLNLIYFVSKADYGATITYIVYVRSVNP